MNKFILILLSYCFVCSGYAKEPALKYVNATTLTVIGKAQDTEADYNRIDTTKYQMPQKTRFYCYASTGLAIVFHTNSEIICARWTLTPKVLNPNTTATAQKGLDLYIKRDGKWVFAGVGNPDMRNGVINNQATLINNMTPGDKECLLYLPLYDRINDLEIGVSEQSDIAPLNNPFRHKIVVHGSSITHGSSASRAGMTYTARMERDMGLYCINLGFSGQCTMQPEFATYLADTKADAFIFDSFSNPSSEIIAQRFDAFVDTIRAKHPQTPLIFLQTIVRETCTFNTRADNYESRKRLEAQQRVKARMAHDPNIYLVAPDSLLGTDHAATVDGIHPTDEGISRMLKKIEPQISRILRKYGID